MKPILRKPFSIQGTELYQPMFSAVGIKTAERKNYYDTEYVRSNSMAWDEGIGKIFMNSSSKIQEYPMSHSEMWIPGITYVFDKLLFEMQLIVFEWQTYVDSLGPSLKRMPKEGKQRMMRQRRLNKFHNTKIVKILREKAEQLNISPLVG